MRQTNAIRPPSTPFTAITSDRQKDTTLVDLPAHLPVTNSTNLAGGYDPKKAFNIALAGIYHHLNPTYEINASDCQHAKWRSFEAGHYNPLDSMQIVENQRHFP